MFIRPEIKEALNDLEYSGLWVDTEFGVEKILPQHDSFHFRKRSNHTHCNVVRCIYLNYFERKRLAKIIKGRK